MSVEGFRAYLKVNSSESTARTYSYIVSRFSEFLGRDPSKASIDDVYRFLSKVKEEKGENMLFISAMALKKFFSYIGRSEIASAISVRSSMKIKTDRTIPEEVISAALKRVIDLAEATGDTKLYMLAALVAVGYEAALRVGEASSLNRSDYIPQDRVLAVKTLKKRGHSVRRVVLSEQVAELLERYLSMRSDSEEAMFVCGDPPRRCSTKQLINMFKRFAKLAGYPQASFHWLRHSRLSRLAHENVPIVVVKEIAGHSSTKTTEQYYIHTPPEVISRFIKDKGLKIR